MKRTIQTIACWLLIAEQLLAGITYHGTTGQTLYVRVQTGASTFVAEQMTEGSSGGLGVYVATDAALVTAGLTTKNMSGYPFTIRSGTESATANDAIVGSGTTLPWSGKGEIPVNQAAAHEWYVCADTDGTGDAGSLEAPFDAFSDAQTAAAPFDTVILVGAFTSTISCTKPLHIRGNGASSSSVTLSNSTQVINFGTGSSGSTLADIFVTQTGTGHAVKIASGLHDFEITACDMDSVGGSNVYAEATVGVRVNQCSLAAASPLGCIKVASANGFEINRTIIGGPGGNATGVSIDVVGINASDGANGVIRNCALTMQRTDAATGDTIGITTGIGDAAVTPSVTIENTLVQVDVANVSATGAAVCLTGNADRDDPCLANIFGGGMTPVTTGSGAAKDIDASVSGSKVSENGLSYTRANCLGPTNIHHLATGTTVNTLDSLPTVAQVWASLTSGLSTSGSIGKLLVDNVDAAISDIEGGGGGSAVQILNTKQVAARTVQLVTRADGTTVGNKTIRLRVDEKLPIWIDASPIAGDGWLSDVTAAESSDEDELAVDDYGINRELAVVVLDAADATVGETYTITVTIVPRAGEILIGKISVTIVGD